MGPLDHPRAHPVVNEVSVKVQGKRGRFGAIDPRTRGRAKERCKSVSEPGRATQGAGADLWRINTTPFGAQVAN